MTTVFLTTFGEGAGVNPVDNRTLSGSERIARNQATAAVRSALAKLPDREKELIELCYYQDLSLKEAGDQLGLSKSWASRLHAKSIRRLTIALNARKADLTE